MKSDLAIFEDY